MDRSQLHNELRFIAQGHFNPTLKNQSGVEDLIQSFIAEVNKMSGVHLDIKISDTYTKSESIEEKEITTTGYVNSLPMEVYKRIDEMLDAGCCVSEIVAKVGVSHNTVTKRRKLKKSK